MLLEPIHAVIVSDGYADYLDVSLSHNRALFSHCVVVTSPADTDSQRVAGKHNCTLIVTGEARSGGRFNKGLLVERGLQQLPNDGWHLHLDADIVLPGDTRKKLGSALIDRACIYGADRLDVVGRQQWQEMREIVVRGWEHQHFLIYELKGTRHGARLVYGDQGWVPIGFFQLWHSSAEYTGIYRTRPYATGSNSAAHDDVQFALRWDRRHRILIPEFFVFHLLTEDQKHGVNWNGRRSKPFGLNETGMPTSSYG